VAECYVGIDLGGTNIGWALVGQDKQIIRQDELKTEVAEGRDKVIGNIRTAVSRAIDGVNRGDIVGIGIGTPGPMSHKEGLIIKPGNLPCMENVHLRKIIRDEFNLPVTLENDANAAAFGEYWAGAGEGTKDLVMFTLGTGVGGGIIHDGKLVRGHFENGSELGHIIVKPGGRRCSCEQLGCLEAYSSASFMAERARELIAQGRQSSLAAFINPQDGAGIEAPHVVAAAQAGDPVATEVFNDACYYLAAACVTMQHCSNPQVIVLAGGMINAGEFLLSRIQQYFRSMTWRLMKDYPRIKFATLGDDAGVVGAAGCVWQAREANDW
jgi:glucokinase